MVLILKSFPLSIIVSIRMIIPLFFIFIASTIILFVLGFLISVLSILIITPATITFITLYGIYVALEKLGKGDVINWRIMITYSVAFSLLLTFLKTIGFYAVQYLALFATQQHLGLEFSLAGIHPVDETAQVAFALTGIPYTGIFTLIFLTVIQTLLAVPMAAAAHNSGRNAASVKVLQVIGTSFIPLFPVLAVSQILPFFLGLSSVFAFLFAALTYQLEILNLFETAAGLISQSGLKGLAELFTLIDPTATLIFFALAFAVLWLQAWAWSASALAFVEHHDALIKGSDAARKTAVIPPRDPQRLRKQRDSN